MTLPADFYLEKRFYYSRLNEYEKDFYRFFLELLLQKKRTFVYTWKEDFNREDEELKGLPVYVYDPKNINIYKVFEAMKWDCPELYYVYDGVLLFKYVGDDFVEVVTVTDNIPEDKNDYSDEEIDELNEKLYSVLREFDGIEDEFELELAVHDYAVKHYDYEMDNAFRPGREFREIFSVVGLLKTGKAVCGGLTRFIQFVLQRRGLTVANLLAMVDDEEDGEICHSWLAIKLGGSFYHLDLTYNESFSLDPYLPQYMYFNLTDEEIVEDGRKFSHEEYPEIVCERTEYNYYHRKGLYFTDFDALKSAFCRFLQGIDKTGEVYYYYFRTPPTSSEQEIRKALSQGWKESKVKTKEKGIAYLDCDGYYAIEIHPLPDEA